MDSVRMVEPWKRRIREQLPMAAHPYKVSEALQAHWYRKNQMSCSAAQLGWRL